MDSGASLLAGVKHVYVFKKEVLGSSEVAVCIICVWAIKAAKEKYFYHGQSNCGDLTTAVCQMPTKAALSLPSERKYNESLMG